MFYKSFHIIEKAATSIEVQNQYTSGETFSNKIYLSESIVLRQARHKLLNSVIIYLY